MIPKDKLKDLVRHIWKSIDDTNKSKNLSSVKPIKLPATPSTPNSSQINLPISGYGDKPDSPYNRNKSGTRKKGQLDLPLGLPPKPGKRKKKRNSHISFEKKYTDVEKWKNEQFIQRGKSLTYSGEDLHNYNFPLKVGEEIKLGLFHTNKAEFEELMKRWNLAKNLKDYVVGN